MKKKGLMIGTGMLLVAMLSAKVNAETVALYLPDTQEAGSVFVAMYQEGRLAEVITAEAVQDGEGVRISIPDDVEWDEENVLQVYLPDQNIVAVPQVISEKPQSTSPSQETQEPVEKVELPYASEAASLQALMLVRDVSMGLDEEEQEAVIVSGYYQGQERTILLDPASVLASAPDVHSELAGGSVSNLQPGDIVSFRASLSGRLTGIDVVFRPMEEDVVATDPALDFAPMLTHNGLVSGKWRLIDFGADAKRGNEYAFGVVKARKGNTLVLTNQAGMAQQDLYIGLSDNTVVYTYDRAIPAGRNNMEIATPGGILASVIPAETKDEDGNIIQWSAEDEHTYVLVRFYDGVAADVVAYMNY